MLLNSTEELLAHIARVALALQRFALLPQQSRQFAQHQPRAALVSVQLHLALPCGVFGPVVFSHGRQLRISAACRARRSGVQPFMRFLFQ